MQNTPFDFTAFSDTKEFVSFVLNTEWAFNHYFNLILAEVPELANLEVADIAEFIKEPVIEMAVKDWYDYLTKW